MIPPNLVQETHDSDRALPQFRVQQTALGSPTRTSAPVLVDVQTV